MTVVTSSGPFYRGFKALPSGGSSGGGADGVAVAHNMSRALMEAPTDGC